ncbi:DUF4169 family protein [Sphingomonas sp. CJ20]
MFTLPAIQNSSKSIERTRGTALHKPMAEIINLNKARKARAKAAAGATADANRIAFGRTKAERAADDAARARAEKLLDDSKRE